MSAGIFIAGVVLTILAMASFQEGGLAIIIGVICILGIIVLSILECIEDNKKKEDKK